MCSVQRQMQTQVTRGESVLEACAVALSWCSPSISVHFVVVVLLKR
mgnify:CR=1 FL=1